MEASIDETFGSVRGNCEISCHVAATSFGVWLEVGLKRFWTVGGLHDGDCGGEDTIERPEKTLGGWGEEDMCTIASKLFV